MNTPALSSNASDMINSFKVELPLTEQEDKSINKI